MHSVATEGAENDYAAALMAATSAAVPLWFRRCVDRLCAENGRLLTPVEDAVIGERIAAAAIETLRTLQQLLDEDVDRQRSNPLSVLRSAVAVPTDLLLELGIAPPNRGGFERRLLPLDVYDLAPATWRDVDDSLHEPGLLWGAWKASVILHRRRAEGRR